jgi:hypothetical protein
MILGLDACTDNWHWVESGSPCDISCDRLFDTPLVGSLHIIPLKLEEALPQPVRSIGERSVASDLCHQFMSYIILNFAKFRCLKLIEVDHRINAYIYIWIRMIRANTTSKFCFFSEEASWNKWFGLQDVWGPLSPKCATRLELSACHQALTDYLNPRIIPFQSVLVNVQTGCRLG